MLGEHQGIIVLKYVVVKSEKKQFFVFETISNILDDFRIVVDDFAREKERS